MAQTTNRPLGRDDLIASHFTLSGADVMSPARFSFADRVAAAASAGFAGIGWTPQDYDLCRSTGLSDAELRTILDDHGTHAAEIEFVSDWAHGDERGKAARQVEDRIYAMADVFGTRHMNVGELGPPDAMEPMDAVAERFAALCERATRHGLLVAMEFLPWTGIPDLKTAWEICRRAGCENGGILLDSWHYFHSGGDAAALRAIPAGHIAAVQLDDAPHMCTADMMYDTLRRCLPGKGVFDLAGLIRLLDEIGVQAPLSVEIISPEHQALPIMEAARVAHDSTAAVIRRARLG